MVLKMLTGAAPLECIKMRLLPSLFHAPRLKLPSNSRPLTFVIIVVIIEAVVVEEEADAEFFQ